LDNAGYLLEGLTRLPQLEVLTPAAAARRAGIVTFRHRQADAAALWQYLDARGVVCAARGGGVRFSPHFYTKRGSIEKVLKLVYDYKI
jgi:selenocysteine lyase/cysteine desulfurase